MFSGLLGFLGFQLDAGFTYFEFLFIRWPIVHEKMLSFKNRVPWYAHREAFTNSFIIRGALTAVIKVSMLKYVKEQYKS